MASVLRQYLPAATGYIIRVAGFDANARSGVLRPVDLPHRPSPPSASCWLGNCGLLTQSGCGTVGGTYMGDFTSCRQASEFADLLHRLRRSRRDPRQQRDGHLAHDHRADVIPHHRLRALRLSFTHAWMGDLTVRSATARETVTVFERVGQNGDKRALRRTT